MSFALKCGAISKPTFGNSFARHCLTEKKTTSFHTRNCPRLVIHGSVFVVSACFRTIMVAYESLDTCCNTSLRLLFVAHSAGMEADAAASFNENPSAMHAALRPIIIPIDMHAHIGTSTDSSARTLIMSALLGHSRKRTRQSEDAPPHVAIL